MNPFDPFPLQEKFAIVLVSLMISRMESSQGRVTPTHVLDSMCSSLVALAADCGVDVQTLKAESEKILSDPLGAMRKAQDAMSTANKMPC